MKGPGPFSFYTEGLAHSDFLFMCMFALLSLVFLPKILTVMFKGSDSVHELLVYFVIVFCWTMVGCFYGYRSDFFELVFGIPNWLGVIALVVLNMTFISLIEFFHTKRKNTYGMG